MNVTAVTIGIGEQHFFYAQKGCQAVKELLSIDTKIITEEHLHYAVGVHNLEKIWSLKFSIFDIFPDIETVMYFDVDWRPLQKFNVLDFCPDPEKIYFAPDHCNTEFVQQLEIKYGLTPGTYVNAGWFVANKKNKGLFQYCRDNICNLDRSFYGDQCVLNQILKNNITIVSNRLNAFTLDSFPLEEILGYHSKDNYTFYKM